MTLHRDVDLVKKKMGTAGDLPVLPRLVDPLSNSRKLTCPRKNRLTHRLKLFGTIVSSIAQRAKHNSAIAASSSG